MAYNQQDQGFFLGEGTEGGAGEGGPVQAPGYDFGSFDYNELEYNTAQGQAPVQLQYQQQQQPSIFDPTSGASGHFNTDPFSEGHAPGSASDPYAEEPPLLEELGINFNQISLKTLAVVNPFRSTDANILHDSDLAGPLVFCLAFGCFLLFTGKVSFGYIYGIGLLGCLSMYALLNLMAPPQIPISVACTVSVLGYCLLPMVLLSGLSVVVNLKSGVGGNAVAVLTVLWCALSASKLFVTALSLQNQQALVLYPCSLLYGVFALLTVF